MFVCASGRARCKNRSVAAAILGQKKCLDKRKRVSNDFFLPSACDAYDKVRRVGVGRGEKEKNEWRRLSLENWLAFFFPRDSLQISPIL